MRLNPIIPIVGRKLKAPMRIGGYDLDRGVMAAPCIYLTHRRPDIWPDPLRFDPERFVGKKISPYAWLPFGGGVRRCIGMAFALYEMKVVLATVLSRFDVARAPGERTHVVRRSISFAPSHEMPVVLTRRD
jgi:cytochrome P450